MAKCKNQPDCGPLKPNDKYIAWIDPQGWVKGRGHLVSIVIDGENGVRRTGGQGKEPWYWGDPNDEAKSLEIAEKDAKDYNLKHGIDQEQADDILNESMFPGYRVRKAKLNAKAKKKK